MTRWLLALAVLVLSSEAVFAAPGDPRVVQGTLEWPASLSREPFVVIRGDDGRVYCADIMGAQRRTSGSVSVGTRVAVAGIEGLKPHEITAMAFGAGDAAALGLSTPAPAPGQAPSGATAMAEAPTEDLWRIEGSVQSVSSSTVTLRTSTGRTFTVDISQLSAQTRGSLRPGETITLYGVPQPDRKLIATGFLQTELSPSASPAGRQ